MSPDLFKKMIIFKMLKNRLQILMFNDVVNSNPIHHLRNEKRSGASLISQWLVGSLPLLIWLLVFCVVPITVPQATTRFLCF